MRTVIVYVSAHHGNTKKLVDAVAACGDVDLIDASVQESAELSGYDLIGFASGVAFGKYYPQLLEFMRANLPEGKKVFFMHTAGNPSALYSAAAKSVAEGKGCVCLGTYHTKGFDTFGPFRLVGGIAKGHPDAGEIAGAAEFYRGVLAKL